jgi:hypothetical protein
VSHLRRKIHIYISIHKYIFYIPPRKTPLDIAILCRFFRQCRYMSLSQAFIECATETLTPPTHTENCPNLSGKRSRRFTTLPSFPLALVGWLGEAGSRHACLLRVADDKHGGHRRGEPEPSRDNPDPSTPSRPHTAHMHHSRLDTVEGKDIKLVV